MNTIGRNGLYYIMLHFPKMKNKNNNNLLAKSAKSFGGCNGNKLKLMEKKKYKLKYT